MPDHTMQFEFVTTTEECSLSELASLCTLSSEQLTDLMECGVLASIGDVTEQEPRFAGVAIRRARIASRLRNDFQLDMHAVSLAVLLVERVQALEAELAEYTLRRSR